MLSYAEGRCLEVGIGTGENLKYYTKQVDVRFRSIMALAIGWC